MSDLDLVLFDLAGTIIQPDPPVEIQYESEARELLPSEHIPPRRTIRERFRVAFKSLGPYDDELRYGTTASEGFFFWKRVIGSVFPTADEDQLQLLTERLYEQFKHQTAWKILSGAKPVLERVSSGPINVGLLTNWDRRCRELVENLNLTNYFDELFISSEIGQEKPDPGFFMKPVKHFDTRPNRSLMVGNKPEVDLEPARDIGMDTLLIVEGEDTAPAGHLWPSVAHSWLDVSNRLSETNHAASA